MSKSETMVASKSTANPTAIPEKSLIFLTGASGYVGGRLLRSLEDQGYRVRCLAEVPCRLPVRLFKRAGRTHGVHHVVGHVDSAQRGVETRPIKNVTRDHFR